MISRWIFEWCFIFLVIIFFGCTNSQSPENKTINKHEIANLENEITQTLINMWDAIEKEDIEKYAEFIHPEFTQFGETDPDLNIGKDVEIEGVKSWIRDADNIHTEMVDPIVKIRGDVAWITYYWKDHGTTNGEEFSSTGKSTRIFVRENNNWLCIHGHYTLLP